MTDKKVIDYKTISNPIELYFLLNAMDKEIDALRTAVNEMRTDHGTFINVVAEIRTDMNANNDHLDNIKTLLNDIRTHLIGDYIMGDAKLATGSTASKVASSEFDYSINGSVYTLAANAVGHTLSGDAIPQNKYGAWRLEIGSNETVDCVEATTNSGGYATAELAIAGLPTLTADHVEMGYFTVINSSGTFTPDSDDLDAVGTTVDYTDNSTMFGGIGAAVSSSVATDVTYDVPDSIIAPEVTEEVDRTV